MNGQSRSFDKWQHWQRVAGRMILRFRMGDPLCGLCVECERGVRRVRWTWSASGPVGSWLGLQPLDKKLNLKCKLQPIFVLCGLAKTRNLKINGCFSKSSHDNARYIERKDSIIVKRSQKSKDVTMRGNAIALAGTPIYFLHLRDIIIKLNVGLNSFFWIYYMILKKSTLIVKHAKAIQY